MAQYCIFWISKSNPDTSLGAIDAPGLAATRAGMKEAAVREPPARIAGVDARAPGSFTLERF
jgi:hypothetical protein